MLFNSNLEISDLGNMVGVGLCAGLPALSLGMLSFQI